jgi:hypothetical protein
MAEPVMQKFVRGPNAISKDYPSGIELELYILYSIYGRDVLKSFPKLPDHLENGS